MIGSTPEREEDSAGASPPNTAESPGERFDDLIAPEARSAVVESVRATTSMIGTNTFHGSVHIGQLTRLGIGRSDITSLVTSDRFVVPKDFNLVCEALGKAGVVAISGPYGSGKYTAGVMALHQSGKKPIFALPSGVPLREVLDEIEDAARTHPHAGFLVESLDGTALQALCDYDGRRIQGLTSATAASVVVTVHSGAADSILPRMPIETVELQSAPAEAILRAHAKALQVAEATLATAEAAISLLPEPVSPRVTVEALRACVAQPSAQPDRLAATLNTEQSDAAIRSWVSLNPDAQAVAVLAVSAALEGALCGDVHQEVRRLAELLQPAPEGESAAHQPFSLNEPGDPIGLVTKRLASTVTHFGRQSVEVVSLCEPHTPHRVISFLWKEHGAVLRTPFSQWLATLAQNPRLTWFAGYTAGLLFVTDPVPVERDLLRPWAMSDDVHDRRCAALALGVPVAVGAEPTAARALALGWSKTSNRNLQDTAVRAYGGLLGAWDASSAAPTHLFRIGFDNVEFRFAADHALAGLIVSGRDTGAIRGNVLSLLNAYVSERFAAARVFGIAATVFDRLTNGDRVSSETLVGLQNESERENLRAIARIVSLALTTPIGFDAGMHYIGRLVAGIDQDRVSENFVVALIRDTKLAGGEDSLSRLGIQLKRVLNTLARETRRPAVGAAGRLQERFFGC